MVLNLALKSWLYIESSQGTLFFKIFENLKGAASYGDLDLFPVAHLFI